MNMLGKFWQSGDCVDQVVAETDRMRGSETKSLKPFDLVNRFEQLHERRFVVDLRKFMATVEIHDLPQQRDFFDAARYQIAHFGHDLANGPAAFSSTRLRHDAESAVHIASLHDRDKSRGLPKPQLLVANRRLRTGFFLNIDDRKSQIIHRAM